MNKYHEALHTITDWFSSYFDTNGTRVHKVYITKEYKKAVKVLQELIDVCVKPNAIDYKFDYIQETLNDYFEVDNYGNIIDTEFNDEIDRVKEYVRDIKLSYAFRVEDAKIVNELQELLGCNVSSIKTKVAELLNVSLDTDKKY